MLNSLKTNKLLWYIVTGLVFIPSLVGVVMPRIYDKVFPPQFIPGAWPQDVLNVLVCIFLFWLITSIKDSQYKKQTVVLSFMATFFYAYGIFTMERAYNFLYLFYLAVFSLSFWSLIYSFVNIKKEVLTEVVRLYPAAKTSAIFGLIIAILFTGLWIVSLIPLMQTSNRIDNLYSIYILDLGFVMPAFFITSIMTLKRRLLGIRLLPAVFILGFFVIFPLGLGEVAKIFLGQTADIVSMMVSFVFATLMLLTAWLHFKED